MHHGNAIGREFEKLGEVTAGMKVIILLEDTLLVLYNMYLDKLIIQQIGVITQAQ